MTIKNLTKLPINGKDLSLFDTVSSVCLHMDSIDENEKKLNVFSHEGNLYIVHEDSLIHIYGSRYDADIDEVNELFKSYRSNMSLMDTCFELEDCSVSEFFQYDGFVFIAEYKENPGNRSNKGVFRCLWKNQDKEYSDVYKIMSSEMQEENFCNESNFLVFCYCMNDDLHFECYKKGCDVPTRIPIPLWVR